MEAERPSALEWKRIAVGLAAFIATPFAVTGAYRVLPEATPYWLWSLFPFAALGALAVALWFVASVPRAISIGIGVGLVVWAVALVWLISAWG